MTIWQYKYVQIKNDRRGIIPRVEAYLNRAGEEGWEFTGRIVEAVDFEAWDYYLMKRVAPEVGLVVEPEAFKTLTDGTLVALHPAVVTVNDFDTPHSSAYQTCAICGKANNHNAVPHGVATGDGLTRHDVIEHLNGRGFRGQRKF